MIRSQQTPVDAQPGDSRETRSQRTLADPDGVQQHVIALTALLKSLDEDATETGQTTAIVHSVHENRLVQVRLGIASSLFTALRAKHPPTAAHSLRVALGCSCFVLDMGLPEDVCDTVEIASLLHDIGKIGVADHLLRKPGKLSHDEAAVMGRHVGIGLEILQSCAASGDVLDVIRYAPAWYDGSRAGFDTKGTEIPLGARIVAIVDAFDAMTTDRVYRPARSRERALAELFEYAGSQFDLELVQEFSRFHARDPALTNGRVARRWLKTLAEDSANTQWQLTARSRPVGEPPTSDNTFARTLVGNTYDGVVFVDSQMQILLWNLSMERLTGMAATAVCQRCWSPGLLRLRDTERRAVSDDACPVALAIQSGVSSHRRLLIAGRRGNETPVDVHVMPVTDSGGITHGATLVLHDMSPEASLEERCASLRDLASKDPLTGVANRAEFDRLLDLFVDAHFQNRLSCALIVCDIDHFKRVNDEYGHQAGDQVIKSLAAVLASSSQPGDVVARYGGEEFVLLYADCSNAAAAARAEQVRRTLAGLVQPALGGGQVTASFGVTELQPGDTPETLFRRADRALLQAKEMGRNLVVQLGAGMNTEERRRRWWQWFGQSKPAQLLETQLVTCVPTEVAIEKLRGFVADHDAKVTSIGDDQVCLTIEGNHAPRMPRHGDRTVPFLIEIKFPAPQPERIRAKKPRKQVASTVVETRMRVVIRPKRSRDRRHEQAAERARQVLASLKSYLMAKE